LLSLFIMKDVGFLSMTSINNKSTFSLLYALFTSTFFQGLRSSQVPVFIRCW